MAIALRLTAKSYGKTHRYTRKYPPLSQRPEAVWRMMHTDTEATARQEFDSVARYYMGISGEEFLRRWDAGEWREGWDYAPVYHVAGALSLVQRECVLGLR